MLIEPALNQALPSVKQHLSVDHFIFITTSQLPLINAPYYLDIFYIYTIQQNPDLVWGKGNIRGKSGISVNRGVACLHYTC